MPLWAFFNKKRTTRLIQAMFAVMLAVGPGMTYFSASADAASCTVSDKLVNSCRPWLGAYAAHYPQVTDTLKSQVLYHESRIGRQGDVVRGEYRSGYKPLTSDELYFINRPDTHLLTTWKPAPKWADAGGSNASVNSTIDKMADNIKTVTPHKIFLSIWHEPENDVTGGATGCSWYSPHATAGTPAQYRAMWANVENRFAARGVTNVVWTLIDMAYSPFNCMEDDLWPGNGLVDWLTFDSYGTKQHPTWQSSAGAMYNFLTSTSDSAHDYLSKPWGVGEFSVSGTDQPTAYSYYDSIKQALDTNQYPKLKLYLPFDSAAGAGGVVTTGENRVAYGLDGNYDATEMAHYKAFAQDPRFTDAFYTTSSLAAPTITSPKDGVVVNNSLNVTAKTSDGNAHYTSLRVDGQYTMGAHAADYNFAYDTTKLSEGSHSFILRMSVNGQTYNTSPQTFIVDHTAPAITITSPQSGASVAKTLNVTVATSDANGVASVQALTDGNLAASISHSPWQFALDVSKLSEGTHSLQLKAYDMAGNVATSSVVSFKVDRTAPSQPSTSLVTGSQASQISLAWSPASDNVATVGYHIYRNGAKVGDVATNTFVDTGLSSQTAYNYKIEAYDAAGNTSNVTIAAATVGCAAGNSDPVCSVKP